MPAPKALHVVELDSMVLDLFEQWENKAWFWSNAGDGKTQDALLKSHILRSTQISRSRHKEESILDWISPESPQILFVAAMVFSTTDETVKKAQSLGLHAALVEHWQPQAINQIFSWMLGHESDNWERCRKAVKKEKGLLTKNQFSLFDNLSVDLQQRLNLCSSLGIKPSAQILKNNSLSAETAIANIGMLL